MVHEEPNRALLIINGEEMKSSAGTQLTRENPADSRRIVTVAEEASRDDTAHAVETAREAFDKDSTNWTKDFKLRTRVLNKTAELIRENSLLLARVISLENGMPMRQAKPQALAAADVFEYYGGWAGKIYGQSMYLPNGAFIALTKEPVGVVGLITPWNFPYTQTARKLAPALAAGCTAVMKPASYTPYSAYLLVNLMMKAGLPKGIVNLVHGKGSVTGAAIVTDRRVDMVSFTGENQTGQFIMEKAAKDMKRIGLELGGKAPFVVFDDADLDSAARGLVFGMYRNAGQACGSTTRLIVSKNIHDTFVDKTVQLVSSLRVGDPMQDRVDIGPVISKDQQEHILGYVKSGLDDGFDLLCGGKAPTDENLKHGYFINPTVFDNVDNDSKIAQEEIFGPVLTVMSFGSEAEAIETANNTLYGLTAAVWTRDSARGFRVSRQIKAGTVWINDNYTQPPEGIWGGFKQSGIGRELGPYGLDEFLEVKQVYMDTTGTPNRPHYSQVISD
ncbi:MAG TPA: aldehyde dehydrogenase family protein [Candidatus Bathyarchaeia archaeon]|nr:aldehyde dehydrogenase family protein [Candidatus Bathyarchaeia archaeon]